MAYIRTLHKHKHKHKPAATSRYGETERLEKLGQAALERFGAQPPTIRLLNGKKIQVTDPARAQRIRIRNFRYVLMRDRVSRDPAFREKAQEHIRLGKPAIVRIEWEDLSGDQRLEGIVETSVECRLPQNGSSVAVTRRELVKKFPCLQSLIGDHDQWKLGERVIVASEPLTESNRAWDRIVRKVMMQWAEEEFLAKAEETR
jgi:hypothetical protein